MPVTGVFPLPLLKPLQWCLPNGQTPARKVMPGKKTWVGKLWSGSWCWQIFFLAKASLWQFGNGICTFLKFEYYIIIFVTCVNVADELGIQINISENAFLALLESSKWFMSDWYKWKLFSEWHSKCILRIFELLSEGFTIWKAFSQHLKLRFT